MADLRTAAQQALEALKYYRSGEDYQPTPASDAIPALKAALVELVEPVAWMVYTEDGKSVCVTDNPNDLVGAYRALPLYTAPQQRKPLTEEEIDELSRTMVKGDKSVNWLCRAIERAHGIKEKA